MSQKTEPLKNKRIKIDIGRNPLFNYNFSEEDIKSAVEWLKEQIYSKISFKHTKEWEKQDELIDEAFEDVLK